MLWVCTEDKNTAQREEFRLLGWTRPSMKAQQTLSSRSKHSIGHISMASPVTLTVAVQQAKQGNAILDTKT